MIQSASIRFKPEASRWRAAKLPFELELFHEGWLFDRPVKLNEIVKGKPTEVPFNAHVFDYAKSGGDAVHKPGALHKED